MSKHKHMTNADAAAVLAWVHAADGERDLTPGRSGAPTGEDEAAHNERR